MISYKRIIQRQKHGVPVLRSLMFASFPIRPLDIKTAEKRILTMAKASFCAMPFYGKKYFQGDIDDIHKLMFEATRGYNPSNKDMIDAMDNTAP